VKLQFCKQYGGFRITLWTPNYLRTLWVNYPHVTKLSRTGSKAHKRFQERARKSSQEFWATKRRDVDDTLPL